MFQHHAVSVGFISMRAFADSGARAAAGASEQPASPDFDWSSLITLPIGWLYLVIPVLWARRTLRKEADSLNLAAISACVDN